jgi:hypothetical protein
VTAGVCRECGCTADRACVVEDVDLLSGQPIMVPCGWAAPDLCNFCAHGTVGELVVRAGESVGETS